MVFYRKEDSSDVKLLKDNNFKWSIKNMISIRKKYIHEINTEVNETNNKTGFIKKEPERITKIRILSPKKSKYYVNKIFFLNNKEFKINKDGELLCDTNKLNINLFKGWVLYIYTK